MPLKEAEAFVLRSHPLGESDRILTFLTRSVGKLRGVAPGARRSRRRFGSNLELLSHVRLRYFERESTELVRVEEAELLESFYRLQEEPERGAVMACFAEVTDAFAQEGQEDEAFFRLLHAVLRALKGGLTLSWAARYFEIWTLKLHGVLPAIDACSGCGATLAERGGRYARREGGVVCPQCLREDRTGGVALPAIALAAAAAIVTRAPVTFLEVPEACGALEPLAKFAEAIFQDVTERRFKSYEVLRSIRGGR